MLRTIHLLVGETSIASTAVRFIFLKLTVANRSCSRHSMLLFCHLLFLFHHHLLKTRELSRYKIVRSSLRIKILHPSSLFFPSTLSLRMDLQGCCDRTAALWVPNVSSSTALRAVLCWLVQSLSLKTGRPSTLWEELYDRRSFKDVFSLRLFTFPLSLLLLLLRR